MQLSTSRWVRIVIALSIVLFMGQNAFGQFGASLQGTVEDSSGNVVPGASVTINNNNTQQTQTQTTGDTGYYRFSELAPGSYNVDITAPNYKKATFSNVNVSAETPRNLDAKLAAGGAAETVTVTAEELPQLQTADASVGGTINQQAIDRLPAAGRDPYELLRLTPGITGDGALAAQQQRPWRFQHGYFPNGKPGADLRSRTTSFDQQLPDRRRHRRFSRVRRCRRRHSE
jgi:hypothetical protein